MNYSHLHLMLNHIPVIGVPLVLFFLGWGIKKQEAVMTKMALFILVLVSLMVIPVYFTGEPAEERIEHLAGVSEDYIAPHEEAAEIALTLTVLAGLSAMVSLWFYSDPKKKNILPRLTFVTGSIAFVSLLYTANLGGKVRHTELRANTELQNNAISHED